MGAKKTVFIVDDMGTNLTVAVEALEKQYRVLSMVSAAKMFAILEKIKPDLILLDIEMPEMDGFEALKQLKSLREFSNIPVIFLTSLNNEETEALGFELGVVDFITKPFSVPVLLNRIKTHLDVDELVKTRTAQLKNLKDSIISVLADMVETRDKNTGGHIERTSAYIKILIESMLEQGVYADEMQEWDIETLIASARLHDIGKIAISDMILNKPGKLNDEEFELIKTHAMEGEHIIDRIISQTSDESFLYHAKLFAGYHHERWDGTGYPRGLKGLDIPLQGRIMALVDVYDALVSDRPYKTAFTALESIDIIMAGSGKHFDPTIADIFFKIKDLFEKVR
jgi:putative two-component system response regulator